jgi:hypothetical protein
MWRLEWQECLYWHPDQVCPAIPRYGNSLGLEQDIRQGTGVGNNGVPESISLNISLGTECGNWHKSLNYIKHHAEPKGASGEWLHDGWQPEIAGVPFHNNKTCNVSPVVISNDALFAELQKCDCR